MVTVWQQGSADSVEGHFGKLCVMVCHATHCTCVRPFQRMCRTAWPGM